MLDFLYQYADLTVWLLQAALAVIFIVHGWPKLKNTKNLFGIGGTIHGLIEIVGGVALILSYYVEYVAVAFAIIMLGAIYFKIFKWKTPFKAENTTGWEFDLILLAVCILLATH